MKDLHLIGFSLGAQLANFASQAIRPYRINRISGLDPAMPLFVGVPNDSKLDASDAKFVDVYHTNAFVQGKVEQCGHVDFYFNGGIIQPGCTSWKDSELINRVSLMFHMSHGISLPDPVGCSHNRAPMYFTESIQTPTGFYAWPCRSYIMYLLNMCPASKTNLVVAGEDVRSSTKGMFFLKTRADSPFAMGRDMVNKYRLRGNDYMIPPKRRDPLLEEIDQWGKLDGSFNNIDQFPTPLPQDPMDDWDYFGHEGPSQIAQQNNYYYTSDNVENDEDVEEGPYGIQVLDVLHRKESSHNRRRPSNNNNNHRYRVKTKMGNSSPDRSHLIERLWEDYNSTPQRRRQSPAVPYWRRRQAYGVSSEEDDPEMFLSQPSVKVYRQVSRRRADDTVEEEEEVTEHQVEEDREEHEKKGVKTTRRPGQREGKESV